MPGYDPTPIEKKWQAFWLAHKTFAAPNTSDKPKFYALDMFPYPSGKGLHVGHPEGYTATDIVSRYKRARGFAVMHPMGWDAFGLPAEQTAIKDGVHPRETTTKNIETFRRQLQALGFSYDWDREVDTTDVGYYRWTQWIFLQLYDTWFDEERQKGRAISDLIEEFMRGERQPVLTGNSGKNWESLSAKDQRAELWIHRLAYQAVVPVNWCEGLGTVLANEEVIDGKSEVGGFPVERKPMKQWMLRITAYADRLLEGLNGLQWSHSLKDMQRNWIGRSEGAEVKFKIKTAHSKTRPSGPNGELLSEIDLVVFTTRPDTLFGATYLVLAPEHPLIQNEILVARNWPTDTPERWKGGDRHRETAKSPTAAIAAYQNYAKTRSDRERQEDTQKTGVFTGMFATNPTTGDEIPIFIADYVLMGYGTGAIMAVPAHDLRDWDFAKQFGLPIKPVVGDSELTKESPELIRLWTKYFAYPNGARYLIHDEHHKFATADEAHIHYFPSGDRSQYAIEFVERESNGTTFIVFNSTNQMPGGFDWIRMEIEWPILKDGYAVNSPWINGLSTKEAKSKIISILEERGLGKAVTNYRIRDWLFSRQRYWGEPFPLVHLGEIVQSSNVEPGTTVPLATSELPLILPELADFKPTGTIDPPLSKAAAWKEVWVLLDGPKGNETARVVPQGTPGALPARRELNTMPQWAGSCWYYIRYTDARNEGRFVDAAAEKFWLHDGVDLYVGGVEHAVLHLLYSRFWHKVLFDRGLVSCDEPFRRLVNQGLILGEAEYTLFKTAAGEAVSYALVDPNLEVDGTTITSKHKETKEPLTGYRVEPDAVEKKGEGFVLKAHPAIRVDARSFKMSKSRGNVVNPDDVIEHYGADSLRLFEMFMGPLEQVKPWSTAGVEGVYRFLQRVWRNMFDENDAVKAVDAPTSEAVNRALHKTIKRVTDDIDRMSFNTAIAAMMEFNNALTEAGKSAPISREAAISFLRLLEPFAPHFAEEVHSRLTGTTQSITALPWPQVNPALLVESTLEIPVQVNGKLRGRITVPADADEATILAAALADPEVQRHTGGTEPKKKIYVKGRMVNLVV